MRFLDIHLEYCDDNGRRLEKIAEFGKPFGISVVPVLLLPEHESFKNGIYPSDYYYPDRIVDILRELAKEDFVVFGQQGFAHYCTECLKTEFKDGGKREFKRDLWHENSCFYKKEKSVEEQIEFMKKGKEVIEDKLKVSPLIYCPPNHMFDNNTKTAAEELGYEFFAVKGILSLAPYREGKLKILPERKVWQNGDVFYTHYDQMNEEFCKYLRIIESSTLILDDFFSDKTSKAWLNEKLISVYKTLRDVKNRAIYG